VQGIIQFGESSAIAGEWEAEWVSSSGGNVTFKTKGASTTGGTIDVSVAGTLAKLTGRSATSVIVALGDTITVTGTIDIAPATATGAIPVGGTIALIGSGKAAGRGAGVLVLAKADSIAGTLKIGSGNTGIASAITAVTTATAVHLTDKNGVFPTLVSKDAGTAWTATTDTLAAAILASSAASGADLGSISGVSGIGAVITGPTDALATSNITNGWKVKVTL
jgi:hypothetical protein